MEQSFVLNSKHKDNQMAERALEKLLSLAKQGDNEAFGQLYTIYFEKVFRYLYYRTSHKETAEDLTEEVFTKAFTKIESFQGDTKNFYGWILVISRNLLIDHYRKQEETLPIEFLEALPSYEKSVLSLMELDETQQALLQQLQELPSDQQAVLKLRFLEDYSISEIAEMLGKSEGNVRIIQLRALRKLRDKYLAG
jgi:RNA polymerase sigma-70 factor (ECF subfamily)